MGRRVKELLEGTAKVLPKTFSENRYERYTYSLQEKKEFKTVPKVQYTALCYGSPENRVYMVRLKYDKKSREVKVRCSCPAMKFYFDWANWVRGAFLGKPTKWTRTASKVHNKHGVAGECKHLVGFEKLLLDMGEIKA